MASLAPKTATVALVGSESLMGREIRDLIATTDFPARVNLVASGEGESGVLTEFEGEPGVVGKLDVESLSGAKAVFLAGSPESTRTVLALETKTPLIDLKVYPDDVDVAQIYDAFSPLIPLSLEGYGFCKRGEGGDFTNDGALEWPNGRLPNNTSGGGMSEAYVHGFNLIVEGVRQIRGTSTSQVENVETSFVTSGEGVPTSALLLRKA